MERLVAKLQQLRQDADQAEERAAQVSEEAKQLAHALEERRANLDSRAQNLVMSRNKVDKLAQVGNLFLASLCLHFTSEVILGTEKSLSVFKSLPSHSLNRSCLFTLPVKLVVGIEYPIIVLQVSESPQSVYNLSIQAVEIQGLEECSWGSQSQQSCYWRKWDSGKHCWRLRLTILVWCSKCYHIALCAE